MIQNESLPVWHYGRGHALTCGRITYLGGDPLAVDDPNVYRVEGALRWDIVDGGPPPDEVIWRARLDTQGITPIVYASADLLYSTAGSEAIQGMVRTFDGNFPFQGDPSTVLITLRNVQNPETGANLAIDQSLCVTCIVSQVGPPQYRSIPYIPPTSAVPLPPRPAPLPPPEREEIR